MDFIFKENHQKLQEKLLQTVKQDQNFFAKLREEIRPLRGREKPLKSRVASALALVAADGGNNQVMFDPFLLYLVQIVDSQRNLQYGPEIITANISPKDLLQNHLDGGKEPKSCLGRLMIALGVTSFDQLSYSFSEQVRQKNSFAWLAVYRELLEWACLYEIITTKDFSNDTVLLFDGLLRSFAFRDSLFAQLSTQIKNRIKEIDQKSKRKIYIAGIAKSSKFLDRYRLAMFLEGVLRVNYPAYVEVPPEIESKAYTDLDYVFFENDISGREIKKSAGRMFLVKFGQQETDPIWPIDIFSAHIDEANRVIESLLNDAIDGFPVPLYPLSLQKAHEYATIADLDFVVLQNMIVNFIKKELNAPLDIIEKFCLQDLKIIDKRHNSFSNDHR